jgi:hypothetical protein
MSEIKRFTLDANIDGMDQIREFVLASDYDSRVHDLETMCDPAGLTAENALLRDQTRMLDAMIGRLKTEAKDAMDTLIAVLNAIGYTEEFAATHPDLKVSEGVRLFLASPTQDSDESLNCDFCGVSVDEPWHTSDATRKHLHTCDACHISPTQGADARPVAIRYDGDDRESRTAFRAYDSVSEPVSGRTSWQIWRDACAWQAARATAEQSRDSVIEECALSYEKFFMRHESTTFGYVIDGLRALKSQQDAAIESKPAEQSIPEGWKLVPIEPTQEMMDAGLYQSSHDSTSADVHSIWKDMVAAAIESQRSGEEPGNQGT